MACKSNLKNTNKRSSISQPKAVKDKREKNDEWRHRQAGQSAQVDVNSK